MDGPEAARMMREELNYRGVIIGMQPIIVLWMYVCMYVEYVWYTIPLYMNSSLWLPSIIIVAGITGNALPDDIDLFVSSGANHVITKPLSRVKLMDALHRFVPMAMALATAGGEQDEWMKFLNRMFDGGVCIMYV